jgi:hypothetical protein
MEKLKVFFSYSQADGAIELINGLSEKLTEEFKSLVDVNFVLTGNDVQTSISKAIWETDLMVPILTSNALSSYWVNSELVRADERGVAIMPVIEKRQLKHLPPFLVNNPRVEYEKTFGLERRILDKILEWRKKVEIQDPSFYQKRAIRRHVGALQRWIQNRCEAEDGKEFRPLQLTLIETILSATTLEVDAVKALTYRQNIGREREFVIRAKPVFSRASEILATSLDTVSTFWHNRELQLHTGDYLEAQSKSGTCRLFVFSSADNAHKYGNLLAAHYRRYGTTGGGVFICSLNAYRHKILPKIAEEADAGRLLSTDFALLTYLGPDSRKEVLEATLDQNLFTLVLHQPSKGLINELGFRKMFNELKCLADGEINQTYEVVRWHPGYTSIGDIEREKWAAVLEELFGGKRHGDIYHIVFFNNLTSEDVRHVLEVKNRILKLKENLERTHSEAAPLEVWFGSRIAVAVNDALGGGRIDVGTPRDAPYVLTMKFSSEEGLKRYYEDCEHSDARRTLYENLRPETAPLFRLIERHADDVKSAVWEVINKIAKEWIERRDYIDNEEFRHIVKKPIPPFNC